MSNINDFVIKDGVLKSYKGSDTEVVIPEGVTSISFGTFGYRSELTSITLPEGLTSIGDLAFHDCIGLTSITLPEGVTDIGNRAFEGCRKLTSITLPDSLTSVGKEAFKKCSSLKSVIIPNGVTKLEDTFSGCVELKSVVLPAGLTEIKKSGYYGLFLECNSLKSLEMNGCKAQLGSNYFGYEFPKGLIPQIPTLYPYMKDGALKQYVLEKKTWNRLSDEVQAEIFLSRQVKALEKAYLQCIDSNRLESLGNAVLECLNAAKPTAKVCNAAAAYMTMFHDKAPVRILNQLYAKLKECNNSAKAIKKVEEHVALMEKLGSEVKTDDSLSPVSQKIMTMMIADKKNAKDVGNDLKDFYGITLKDLPVLKSGEGLELEPFAAAWLFTAHGRRSVKRWFEIDMAPSYRKTELSPEPEEIIVMPDQKRKGGLRPEVEEIVAMLDQSSLQASLLKLADDYLGSPNLSKKRLLAYPICCYADEDLMDELTKRAPKWRSNNAGDDALPLAAFRNANRYSNTRAAMFFAERYHELDKYAVLRGMTEDEVRDGYLSDLGLDEQGSKEYDLGNQTVTARLQTDMSLLVELPDGKTAKSLPKKGADPEKYEAATKDFTEVKRYIKRILNNRSKVLFKEFQTGKARSSEEWQNLYLHNPLLREAASLVVWSQGKNTFTLKDGAPIDSAEQPYTITENEIVVAHPIEIEAEDTKAWQKYFTAHGLKQPFAQIWEPVHKAEEIKEDRYKGYLIPYYRFKGQEKHGIWIRGGLTKIVFEDCIAYVEYISKHHNNYNVDINDLFDIQMFRFKEYTRQVNHIVAYLDRVTVWDRVRKDDLSVMDMMDGFTLAQITDFIAAAQEANAHNVLAALLEYKNNNFSDFDPMDEFTLEW